MEIQSSNKAAAESLLALIRRLDAILLAEQSALSSGKRERLAGTASQKVRVLSELSRLRTPVWPGGVLDPLRPEIVSIQSKLEHNRELLARHLKASAEVAGAISAAIGRAESDGTYGRNEA